MSGLAAERDDLLCCSITGQVTVCVLDLSAVCVGGLGLFLMRQGWRQSKVHIS